MKLDVLVQRARIVAGIRAFYDKELGAFVSGKQRQISFASNVWMVLAQVFDKRENREILSRLPALDALPMVTPYMYHHYVLALIESGLGAEARLSMDAYWGAMVDDGADTFYAGLKNPVFIAEFMVSLAAVQAATVQTVHLGAFIGREFHIAYETLYNVIEESFNIKIPSGNVLKGYGVGSIAYKHLLIYIQPHASHSIQYAVSLQGVLNQYASHLEVFPIVII